MIVSIIEALNPAMFYVGWATTIAIVLGAILFLYELYEDSINLLYWRLTWQLCSRCRQYPVYRHAPENDDRLCGLCFDYDRNERRAAQRLIREGYTPGESDGEKSK